MESAFFDPSLHLIRQRFQDKLAAKKDANTGTIIIVQLFSSEWHFFNWPHRDLNEKKKLRKFTQFCMKKRRLKFRDRIRLIDPEKCFFNIEIDRNEWS